MKKMLQQMENNAGGGRKKRDLGATTPSSGDKKGPTGPKINKGRTGARGGKMKTKPNYFEMAEKTMGKKTMRGKK